MDIYSFINSADIGEYFRELNHKFNPLEAAYLVWRSGRRTLKERHAAWQKLINTTPDIAIPDTQYHSLHEFLNSYMKMENDFLKEFYAADDDSIYSCAVFNEDGKEEFFFQDSLFKTIDDCFEFIQELEKDVIEFYICKSPLSRLRGVISRHESFMELGYSPNFEPLRITSSLCKTDLFHTFCAMCPVVPTPFKKGDIVKLYNAEYHKNRYNATAFVLDAIGYLETTDNEKGLTKSANYNAILYSHNRLEHINSILYTQIPNSRGASNEIEAWGFIENYLDLEYYHGELKGKERILTGIGNYLKGNINLSFLLNTYSVIAAETNFTDMILPVGLYGWDDEPLKLGGWTDKDVRKFEKIHYDLLKESGNLIDEDELE